MKGTSFFFALIFVESIIFGPLIYALISNGNTIFSAIVWVVAAFMFCVIWGKK